MILLRSSEPALSAPTPRTEPIRVPCRDVSLFLGRVRARSRRRTRGAPATGTGSGGGARPGSGIARPGDSARSPASNHAAYLGHTAEAWAAHRWAMPRSLNASFCPAPQPRFPQPPQGPRRQAHASATHAAASAPLADLGIHGGCRAWSRQSTCFKRIPEAPRRDEVSRHLIRI